VFVLTHLPGDRSRWRAATFAFVTDGIESVLAQARAAAAEEEVAIASSSPRLAA
jgi:hypothetical protein